MARIPPTHRRADPSVRRAVTPYVIERIRTTFGRLHRHGCSRVPSGSRRRGARGVFLLTARARRVVRTILMAAHRGRARVRPMAAFCAIAFAVAAAGPAWAVCGDGILDPGEACDPLIAGSDCCTVACTVAT